MTAPPCRPVAPVTSTVLAELDMAHCDPFWTLSGAAAKLHGTLSRLLGNRFAFRENWLNCAPPPIRSIHVGNLSSQAQELPIGARLAQQICGICDYFCSLGLTYRELSALRHRSRLGASFSILAADGNEDVVSECQLWPGPFLTHHNTTEAIRPAIDDISLLWIVLPSHLSSRTYFL